MNIRELHKVLHECEAHECNEALRRRLQDALRWCERQERLAASRRKAQEDRIHDECVKRHVTRHILREAAYA